jgi:phage baseplate assembly protein W
MATSSLGSDLKVTLGPPGLVAQDSSGLDLRSLDGLPFGTRRDLDLSTIGERENLAQALILRLLTPRGALAGLGHANYGSRVGELIGRRKTVATRALCKAFVLEAVAQEPRVEPKAVAFAFDAASEGPSELRFTLTVRPRNGAKDLQLDLAVKL